MRGPGNHRIGIDLGGTKIEAILLDDDGRDGWGGHERWRHRVATPVGDYAGTLRAIADLVAAAEHHARTRRPVPVGIGIPGTISSASGLVKNANSTWLVGQPLREDLAVRLGREVRVANDANCFALSEAIDGVACGADSVMGVILGTGVGSGLVIGGQVIEGVNGIAGEWGHNPLPRAADGIDRDGESPGLLCYCGRHGCIETWLSGRGFAADHQRATGQSLSVPRIIEAMRAGDEGATASFGRYVDRLARGLAGVINIVDPHAIVLGGGLSSIDELYRELPLRLPAYVFSDRVDTRVLRNRHGDSSGVRGAAWLWPLTPAERRGFSR